MSNMKKSQFTDHLIPSTAYTVRQHQTRQFGYYCSLRQVYEQHKHLISPAYRQHLSIYHNPMVGHFKIRNTEWRWNKALIFQLCNIQFSTEILPFCLKTPPCLTLILSVSTANWISWLRNSTEWFQVDMDNKCGLILRPPYPHSAASSCMFPYQSKTKATFTLRVPEKLR